MTIAAHPPYAHRPAPSAWDRGWINTELLGIENAIVQWRGRLISITPPFTDQTLRASDTFLMVDATGSGVTINLLDPSRVDGQVVTIKKIDAGPNGVVVGLDYPVDGGPFVLGAQYDTVTIGAASGRWHLLGANTGASGGDGSFIRGPGVILRPPLGVTVPINGSIDAGRYQLFDLSLGGTIAINTAFNPIVYPEWFASAPAIAADCSPPIKAAFDAVGASATGGTVELAGDYHLATHCLFSNAHNVTFAGLPGTVITTNLTATHAFEADSVVGFTVKGITVKGKHACAFAVSSPTKIKFEDVDLSGGTSPETTTGLNLCGGIWMGGATDFSFVRVNGHGNGNVDDVHYPKGADILIGQNGTASTGLYSEDNHCLSTAVAWNYMCFSTSHAVHVNDEVGGARYGPPTVPVTPPYTFGQPTGYGLCHYSDIPGASHHIQVNGFKAHDTEGMALYFRSCLDVGFNDLSMWNVGTAFNDGALPNAAVSLLNCVRTVGSVININGLGDKAAGVCIAFTADPTTPWVTDASSVSVSDLIINGSPGRPAVYLRGGVSGAVVDGLVATNCASGVDTVFGTVPITGVKVRAITVKTTSAGIDVPMGFAVRLLNATKCEVVGLGADDVWKSALVLDGGGSGNYATDIQANNASQAAAGTAAVVIGTDGGLVTDAHVTHDTPGTAVGFQFTGALPKGRDLDATGLGTPVSIGSGATPKLYDCPGYNPVGPQTAVTAGTSPYTFPTTANRFHSPATVQVSGGTVSLITKNGGTIATGTGVSVRLEPLEQIVITHTGAPSLIADVH